MKERSLFFIVEARVSHYIKILLNSAARLASLPSQPASFKPQPVYHSIGDGQMVDDYRNGITIVVSM